METSPECRNLEASFSAAGDDIMASMRKHHRELDDRFQELLNLIPTLSEENKRKALLTAAASKWSETPWEEGCIAYDCLAKKLSLKALVKELYVRLSETDAFVSHHLAEHDEVKGRVAVLEEGNEAIYERLNMLETAAADLEISYKETKQLLQERRASSQSTSTSASEQEGSDGVECENRKLLVIRGLQPDRLAMLQKGEWEWLLGGPGVG